jgi:tetratricopeptide (TPR) repeat protein
MLRLITVTLLVCAALAGVADTLVLKSGQRYQGTITVGADGKLNVATAKGTLSYAPDLVSFTQTVFSEPPEAKRAFELLKTRDYTTALPLFQKMEQRFSGLPTVWYERALFGVGKCLANSDTPAQAKPVYEKLLQMFPQTRYKSEVSSDLIKVQMSGALGPQDVARLQTLLQDPQTPDRLRAQALQGLAKYYDDQAKPREALEAYAAVLVLHGDQDELQQRAQRRCADLFLQLGRTNEASFYYQQIVDLYPATADAQHAQTQLTKLTPRKGD